MEYCIDQYKKYLFWHVIFFLQYISSCRTKRKTNSTFMTQTQLSARGGTRQKSRSKALQERPPWVKPSTKRAVPTPDLMVTHINQTHDQLVSEQKTDKQQRLQFIFWPWPCTCLICFTLDLFFLQQPPCTPYPSPFPPKRKKSFYSVFHLVKYGLFMSESLKFCLWIGNFVLLFFNTLWSFLKNYILHPSKVWVRIIVIVQDFL